MLVEPAARFLGATASAMPFAVTRHMTWEVRCSLASS